MSSSLLQTAKELLTPDIVARASSLLGEPQELLSKALTGGAIPLLLSGLAGKVERGGAGDVLALVRDAAFDPAAHQNAGSLIGEGGAASGMRQLGERLLGLLFGGRLESAASALAQFAGIRPSSASSLLRFAAPLVLGLVGTRARRDGLDASGLTRLFAGEREDLARVVPAPLRSALGVAPARAAEAVSAARSGASRWLWLGLAAIAVALLWSVMRDRGAPRIAATDLPDVSASRAIDWVNRRLPDGTDLRIPSSGTEARLVGVLEGQGSGEEWVDFDRLLFATNSATLEPRSQEQLRNIASILAAYPSARIKIGGYTDDTGDSASNLKLSRDRAASVQRSLVDLGVAEGRLEAEGYGEQHPVASNATDEGRAKNRRIAMRVTSR